VNFRRCAVFLAALCVAASSSLLAGDERRAGPSEPAEVRALWVQRTSLTSAASVTSLVEAARAAGFNTLLVQVRGRGDAYYKSRLEPRGAALTSQDPSFDPLELVVAAGHRAGLRVHAWVNVNLVSDAEPPAARTHVVYAHPEWLMVPRELAVEMSALDRRSPEYLAMLSRYARAHADQLEGLYLSPLAPGAVDYTVRVVSDIVARYGVDGIHLDYARYPNDDFDYSKESLAQFRADVMPHVTVPERRDYERRAKGRPLFYTQMFPQRWQEFRRARLTALVVRLRAALKSNRREVMLSAAVWPDPAEAANRRLQDWRGWIESKLLDAICPMAYTTDPALFRSQIAGVTQIAGALPVWAGIGAYHLPLPGTIQNIETARRLGARGIVLFSYDNLDRTYLSGVDRGAFGR
jgi:uncharacterized lipoprotein YddW (UPF0748 family)